MWKCIFSTETNRGTGCNREPQEGEYAQDIHPSQCAWFNVTPERYMWTGSELVERPEWEAEEAARQAAMAIELENLRQRIAEIEAAQEAEGLKQYTVQQANDWITNKLTNAPNTIAGVKQACGEIFLKMVPYLLK